MRRTNLLPFFRPLFLLSMMLVVLPRPAVARVPVLSVAGEVPVPPRLPNGIWQASILRPDGQQIRFTFETKDSAGKKILYVMNGTERLLVDQFSTNRDSLFIDMPFFDSHFALQLQGDTLLKGSWIKISGPRRSVTPFEARLGESRRFVVSVAPSVDVSGRWAAAIGTEQAVGEFKQTGAHVTGTFLTSTGDYRFLEGVVAGDSLQLSTFDGGHAYYFSALVTGGKMTGHFYAGATGSEGWTAEKDDQASLPDEFSVTRLKDPTKKHVAFSFRSIDGKTVSLTDPAFKNKVVVLQIMGSWCPNCMDETRFLSDYYQKNKQRGVEIIALAYERTTDFDASKRSLESFRRRFAVAYPVLVTGVTVTDSLKAEKTLPVLQDIVGFPTTIFIDRQGNVSRIDTGFTGPGTGDHYEIFKKEFATLVDSLLK